MVRKSAFGLAVLVGLSALFLAQPSWGDDPIVRIEEDWELEVTLPDSNVSAPARENRQWHADPLCGLQSSGGC